MKCDKDCFNCKYDDCIISERNAVSGMTTRPYVKRNIVAKDRNEYNRIYHELFDKDKKAVRNKRYQETHKEEVSAWHKAYYQRKKGEKCSAESVSTK